MEPVAAARERPARETDEEAAEPAQAEPEAGETDETSEASSRCYEAVMPPTRGKRRREQRRRSWSATLWQAAIPSLPLGTHSAIVGPSALARIPSLPPLRRAALSPEWPLLDETVPHYDPTRTEMLQRLPLRRVLRLVQELPAAVDGQQRRERQRVEDLLGNGPWSGANGLGWKGYLYVRGESPPKEPYIIHPPRAVVFALFRGRVVFLETVSPRGDEAATPMGVQHEEELLDVARWAVNNLPVLPRKGSIHKGMPGKFYMHGVHASMAPGARHQVQRFWPEGVDEGEYYSELERVRRISERWQQQVP